MASIIMLNVFIRLAGLLERTETGVILNTLAGRADLVSAMLWLLFLRLLSMPGPDEKIIKQSEELQKALDKKTAELAKANGEMESLGYSITHDLRAPLRAIDGFSAALLEDCAGKLDKEEKGNLEMVRASASRMTSIMDSLAVFFRVTRSALKKENVDLGAMAERIIGGLRDAQPGRPVEFLAEKGLEASVDRDMLRLALENLLGNSWKFTRGHAAARIEFGSAEKDGRKVYFIRDDGAGFDMNYKAKLFAPFQRLHSTREFEGAGLGLAITRRIIERHDGSIWAEGEAEKGATFYFTLG